MVQPLPLTPSAAQNHTRANGTTWPRAETVDTTFDGGAAVVVNGSGSGPGLEGRPPVEIEQGPEWLVDLYLTPPEWLNPLLQVVAVVVLALVAYRLWQRGWRVDGETQLRMGGAAGTIIGVILGVLAMANWTDAGYAVDVGVGLLVGWGGAQAALSAPVRERVAGVVPVDGQRRAAAWALVAVLSILGPMVVAVAGRGTSLVTGRLILAAVAVGMVGLNLAEARDEGAFG